MENRIWKAFIKNLNTRWLVSAADTFADHAIDPVTKA